MKKRKILKEVWIGLGLTLFSLFFLSEANKLMKAAAKYPKFILTTLLTLSAALLVQSIFYSLFPDKQKKQAAPLELGALKFPMLVTAAIILYVVLFNVTNFFVATVIFVPLMMLLYGERRMLRILLGTVGLELFVWLVFVQLLNVYFPM